MSRLHRFLNYPKKVHKYTNPKNSGAATIYDCKYCDDIFFVGKQEDVPFGIGAKYPNEQCTRSKL